MTETYQPQMGDRVKVTIEGVAEAVSLEWFDLGANCIPMNPDHYAGATYVVEKLQDPEPEWVNGDVVRLSFSGAVFVRSGGAWRHVETNQYTSGNAFPGHWRNGNLEILYKAGRR